MDVNYMKKYELMNIDYRVKLIVMCLNKVHHVKNETNGDIHNILDEEFKSFFGNKSTHQIKNFFYDLYQIKESPQKILKKKSDFITILNTNLFSEPNGDYIQDFINNYQKSIDTDSLENVLQAMIYDDKNINLKFDELQIDENNKENFKSLEDKIKKLQILDENFLNIYPEYHILQDCVKLYKTIDIFKKNNYNKLNNKFIFTQPVSFIDMVDMIIKHFMKHLHPIIKQFGLIKDELVEYLEKLLNDFFFLDTDSIDLNEKIIKINSTINSFLYTVIQTKQNEINNMEQIFSNHYDRIKIFKTYLNYLKEYDKFKEDYLNNIDGLEIFVDVNEDYSSLYSIFYYIVELYNWMELIIDEYKTKNNLVDYFRNIIGKIHNEYNGREKNIHFSDFFYKFALVIDEINELSFENKNMICEMIIAKFDENISDDTRSYINILIDKYNNNRDNDRTPLLQSVTPTEEHKSNSL